MIEKWRKHVNRDHSAADGIVLRTRWESSGKNMSALIVQLI